MKGWIGLEEMARRQLARVGIAPRHAREFAGDSAKWSPRTWQDFFGRADAARMAGGAGGQIMSVLPPGVLAMPDFACGGR